MRGIQLGLEHKRSIYCPFTPFLEDFDNHCQTILKRPDDYDTFSCEDQRLPKWLKVTKGVGFSDILAKKQERIGLPSYVPMIPHGSGQITSNIELPWAAVTLNHILSKKECLLPINIRKHLGINDQTKIILLNYALDKPLEHIWPRRDVYFETIAKMGFNLVTAIDYSIWHDQQHAERLINLKRSLITFSDFQNFGIPTVPHVYWYGRKDLSRWAEWLNNNPEVYMMAINLQTINQNLWDQTLLDLKYFVSILPRPVKFLITGPSNIFRIHDIGSIIPDLILTNTLAAMLAHCWQTVDEHGKGHYSGKIPKNQIFQYNIHLYDRILHEQKIPSDSIKQNIRFPVNIPIKNHYPPIHEIIIPAAFQNS